MGIGRSLKRPTQPRVSPCATGPVRRGSYSEKVREGILAPAVPLSLLLFVALCAAPGCVRRTLRITTDPPQALVSLNDQEVGHSEVSTDFLWYGDYEVVIRKDGFQTLHTNWNVEPPWYQVLPFDFFFEVFWPGKLHDVHERHFELIPVVPIDSEALIERAMVTRDRALDPRK